jgi:transposase
MAGTPIIMSQLKQVLRLLSLGYSIKGIVRETGVSRNTIKGYRGMIESKQINIEEALKMEELQLEQFLRSPVATEKERQRDFMTRLDKLFEELKHPHLTKQLLWEEYKREYPEGYQYSRFCYYLQLYDRSQKAVLVGQHSPGDKLFVDFTGDKLHYVDRSSGEIIACDVFIATLGYSNYTVVTATHSQKKEDVISATVRSLELIGGAPKAIVPDNLKAAITQSNRYEPTINESFLDMANHYAMVVLPARAGKPKDKAKVERSVTITYQRIFAVLRKQTFYSLNELNEALAQQAANLNDRIMQQYDCSRRVMLERDERPLLCPLPDEPYQLKQQLILTVQANCHVYLSMEKRYYSAPYRYIGFKVHVILTSSLVRIYYQGTCVATHARDMPLKYNTVKEHLPSHHQIVLSGINEQSLKERAGAIGAPVLEVIERVLKTSTHPEQAYKSCQGILALIKKTSKEILIQSCTIALQFNACSYRHVQRIALGRYANRDYLQQQQSMPFPSHPNIRGSSHYI